MSGENNPMFGTNAFTKLSIEKQKEIREKLRQNMLKNPINSKESPVNGKRLNVKLLGESIYQ